MEMIVLFVLCIMKVQELTSSKVLNFNFPAISIFATFVVAQNEVTIF